MNITIALNEPGPLEWGWPTATVQVHPWIGDCIQYGARTFVVDGFDGHRVSAADGHGSLMELRMSATADGLFVCVDGTEEDGWRAEIAEKGIPGHRRWIVARGRGGKVGGAFSGRLDVLGEAGLFIDIECDSEAASISFDGSAPGATCSAILFGPRLIWTGPETDVLLFAGPLGAVVSGHAMRAGQAILVRGTSPGPYVASVRWRECLHHDGS